MSNDMEIPTHATLATINRAIKAQEEKIATSMKPREGYSPATWREEQRDTLKKLKATRARIMEQEGYTTRVIKPQVTRKKAHGYAA